MESPPMYQVPALMITSILYGLNVYTFFSSLRHLFRGGDDWKRGRDINFPMAAVAIILFMSSTTSVMLQLAHVMRDYMYLKESREQDFRVERNKIDISKMILVIVATSTADCVLLFRCWIIWNKTFLAILLPLLTWVGCLGSSIYAVQCLYFRIPSESDSLVLASNSYPGLLAFWTCTIIVNVYCTGMIVGRIYSVQQGWRPPTICSLRDVPQRVRLRLAKRIIIESAMLYTAASVTSFIAHICKSGAVELTCLVEVQMIGIAFNLILIRPSRLNQDHESEISVIQYSLREASRATVSVGVGTVDTCVEMP